MIEPGILFVIGTPIGNLNDITFRAVQTIKEIDIIVAEDTYSAFKILNKFEILNKKVIQYSENTHEKKTKEIISFLKDGKKLGLISKAGTPSISDPGSRLIKEIYKNNYKIIPIPGVSAPITALSVSPFDSRKFIFIGFLPRKKGKIKKLLNCFSEIIYDFPIVIFESPYRIKVTLELLKEIYGSDLYVFYTREMTKIYEEFSFNKIQNIIENIKNKDIKGEITIIIKKEKSI